MESAPENLQIGFVLICSACVFLMQAGFCLLESGLVRTKNSINVAVKNIVDCAIAVLMFTTIGFTCMFGDSFWGFIGTEAGDKYLSDPKLLTFFLYQLVFCSTAATIVSGAVAERIKLGIYAIISLVLAGFVYPIFGHWAWGGTIPGTQPGWLAELGFIDWAGASVIHIVGGSAALAAAQLVGRRRNLNRDALTGGSSFPLAILGTFLLWFGWWGFNGGSGLSLDETTPLIILNTNFGAIGGIVAAMIFSLLIRQKIEVVSLISGLLAGLVSVTAACHLLAPSAAIIAGMIGSIIAQFGDHLLKRLKIDDAVNAFPIHGLAGIWGVLVVGIFGSESAFGDNSRWFQILVQGVGAVAAFGFSYGSILGVLAGLKRFRSLRVKAYEEKIGLNVVEHGATNDVSELVGKMTRHGALGIYHEKVESDPFTEVGMIANQYNRVIEKVNEEIIHHERTNEELQREQIRLQSVFDNARIGIYQLTPELELISANRFLLEMFGVKCSDELAEFVSQCVLPWHREDPNLISSIHSDLDSGKGFQDLETEVSSFGGKQIWILESLVPIRCPKGKLISWLGTVNDVSQQKRAFLSELEIAEAKSEAKGQFLANMSHEIRTPLNGVIGMLDLLDSCTGGAKERHYVTIARSSANALLSLINDILDFSKIEAGKLELENISFKLAEIVEETAQQFAILAHNKNLEMNCDLASDLPFKCKGDPERLRQVMTNLLGNSIKFTEKGEINLRVNRRGNVIRFSVQDTGIGMSKAVREKLFESFMQADPSTTRKYGGTGLGLTISNQLLALMNSQISVESELGVGSEFWFEVALEIIEEKSKPVSTYAPNLLDNKRVLIVDDNSTNCDILTNQMLNWGMQASVCQKPGSVVQKLLVAQRLNRPFDLIVLDFCMPELNGRDVAVKIKEQPGIHQTPIILLSSNYDLLSQGEQQSIGISAALTKPARQSRLFDTIVNVIESNENSGAHVESDVRGSLSPPTVRGSSPEPIVADFSSSHIMPLESVSVNSPDPQPESDLACQTQLKSVRPAQTFQLPTVTDGKVLIAEDNEVNQMVVHRMLDSIGFDTTVANNGKEALDLVRNHEPISLILMDGHMPVLDGLEATREIRKWESIHSNRRIPIIALTANVVEGIQKDCKDAGMDGYLCKPITLERLTHKIGEFIDLTESDAPAPSPSPLIHDVEHPVVIEAEPKVADPKVSVSDLVSSSLSNQRPRRTIDELIEIERLHAVCDEDLEFISQILGIMVDSLPRQIELIENAAKQNDLKQVANIAHQMKGAAGDSCLTLVYQTATALENNAKNQSEAGVRKDIEQLKSRIDETLEAIEESFEQLRKNTTT
ncbi:MAG: ammonium transporter [Planctomycetota bacterium]